MQNSIKIWSATKKNKKIKMENIPNTSFYTSTNDWSNPQFLMRVPTRYARHTRPKHPKPHKQGTRPCLFNPSPAQTQAKQKPRPTQTQAKAQTKAPARGDAVAAQIFSFFLLRVRMVWCDDGVDEGRGDYRGDRVRE